MSDLALPARSWILKSVESAARSRNRQTTWGRKKSERTRVWWNIELTKAGGEGAKDGESFVRKSAVGTRSDVQKQICAF